MPKEQIIASYSGIDLATGKGIGKYYLFGISGTDYLATTDSATISNSNNYYVDSQTSGYDLDFDITILNKMTVEGLSFASAMVKDSSGAGAHNFTLTFKVIKYDGVSETELASETGTTTVQNAGFGTITTDLDLQKTTFNKGDILRLNVVVPNTGAFGACRFYFDPSNLINTDAAVLSTKSFFQIPILINL